ncbi:MAG: helix-turn-helix domain-containing protein [Intestinibacillus sp.]
MSIFAATHVFSFLEVILMSCTFYPRIRELRLEHDLTCKDAAHILNCSIVSYRKLESGKRQLRIPELVSIARFYNVSADYVIDRTDQKTPHFRI